MNDFRSLGSDDVGQVGERQPGELSPSFRILKQLSMPSKIGASVPDIIALEVELLGDIPGDVSGEPGFDGLTRDEVVAKLTQEKLPLLLYGLLRDRERPSWAREGDEEMR